MSYFSATVRRGAAGFLLFLSAALAPLSLAQQSQGDERKDYAPQSADRGRLESPHAHEAAYPSVGTVFSTVPGNHEVIYDPDGDLYYASGVWYRRDAPDRFVVAEPPIGVTVAALPTDHETIDLNGVTHYRANQILYLKSPQGYIVVAAGNVTGEHALESSDAVSPSSSARSAR